ncbi:hypothetical protein [Pseudomonas sp. Pdm06]|uniref:hypothetical protein n=1 Tax=Pseudomonas sp. Pdm06 TaxID=1790044 RepID=UPI001785A6CE|nr:hypothetical protein [Pseudomonas sp. Pdm06]MBD9463905.1 hypothetical protein [Pseudomonas sp. Pdm06]
MDSDACVSKDARFRSLLGVIWNVFKRVALDMFTAIKRGEFSSLSLEIVLLQIQRLMGRSGLIDIKRDHAVDNTLADALRNLPTFARSNDVLSRQRV